MLSAFRACVCLIYIHGMNRLSIRISLIMGVLTVILVTAVQIYFVHAAFNREDRQLDQQIQMALRTVSEQMSAYNDADEPFSNPVKRLQPDYYVVNVNGFIDAEVLEYFIVTEFQRRGLEMDLEFGIYDCSSDEMVYGRFISFGQKQKTRPVDYEFSKYSEYLYYFGVFFPGRSRVILNSLGVWYFFSAVLLIVLTFFIYTQIIILKQRRLTEVQKDFINNLTHELKTPLSAIRMSSDVLVDQDLSREPHRLRQYGQIISQKASELIEQVDRILITSDQGFKKNFHPQNMELSAAVQEVYQEVKSRIEATGGQLEIDCPDFPVSLHADRLLLKQLLQNVLDNAILYSDGPPDIRMTVKIDGKKGILEISDRGIGIPKGYEKRVFARFFRVPKGNVHDVKGFGLGLYHARKVAKLHRWVVQMKPNPGGGSVFSLRFKRKEA